MKRGRPVTFHSARAGPHLLTRGPFIMPARNDSLEYAFGYADGKRGKTRRPRPQNGPALNHPEQYEAGYVAGTAARRGAR